MGYIAWIETKVKTLEEIDGILDRAPMIDNVDKPPNKAFDANQKVDGKRSAEISKIPAELSNLITNCPVNA